MQQVCCGETGNRAKSGKESKQGSRKEQREDFA